MHSNSYRLVRAVEKCQNLYSCIGGGRGAQNISTKQYWFRQYQVTSNSFKTHPLQKYPNFLLTQSHPTQGKEKLYGMRIKSTLKYKIKIQWIKMYNIPASFGWDEVNTLNKMPMLLQPSPRQIHKQFYNTPITLEVNCENMQSFFGIYLHAKKEIFFWFILLSESYFW